MMHFNNSSTWEEEESEMEVSKGYRDLVSTHPNTHTHTSARAHMHTHAHAYTHTAGGRV